MIRLVYTSVATQTFGSGEIFKIVETSASNNSAADLTGFLIFANNRFFQVIEGSESAIDALFRRIETDPRHCSIKVIDRSAIDQRAFPRWRMKRIMAPSPSGTMPQLPDEFADVPAPIKSAAEQFLGLAAA